MVLIGKDLWDHRVYPLEKKASLNQITSQGFFKVNIPYIFNFSLYFLLTESLYWLKYWGKLKRLSLLNENQASWMCFSSEMFYIVEQILLYGKDFKTEMSEDRLLSEYTGYSQSKMYFDLE